MLLIGALMLMLVARRVRRRGRREYALYELHLSTHDQAKGQDLEDMVESIANIVRAWPAERIRNGQPYVALELICGVAPAQRRAARDGVVDQHPLRAEIGERARRRDQRRLPRRPARPHPRRAAPARAPACCASPGYVMRFRKERSFVYSLIADGEEQASAPLEQIARAQVAVAAPTVVRFQLTPTPSRFEALARRLYRRHENKLVRQERWGLPEGGLTSTFNRAEMRAAERTQNRSLFWLETVVAADTPEACKTVAAAVQSRRGENRLHRRWMIVRQGLYRRRFPRALGPLIPSFRIAGVGRRGRAPARAALGADEGRSGPPGDDPANPGAARGRPRHPPTPPARRPHRPATPATTVTGPAPSACAEHERSGRRELRAAARTVDTALGPRSSIRCFEPRTRRC